MRVKIGSKLCRVCLCGSENHTLFFDDLDLLDKFQYTLSITLSRDDSLPLSICKRCIDRLKIAYHFKQQCEKSENHLRSFVININEKLLVKKEGSDAAAPNHSLRNVNDGINNADQYVLQDDYDYGGDNDRGDNSDAYDPFQDYYRFYASRTDVTKPRRRGITDLQNPNKQSKQVKKKRNKYKKKPKIQKPIKKSLKKPYFLEDISVCETCNEPFKTRIELLRHMKVRHKCKMQQEYKCDVCGLILSRYPALKRHISSRHLKTRDYVCDYCNKGFNQKDTLRVHIRLHSGELPYICSECGLGFRSSSMMSSHQKRHLDDGDRENIECTDCHTFFRSKTGYTKHMRVHHTSGPRLFPCTKCDEAFETHQEQKLHSRQHIGERPFKCDQCDRDFAREIMLTLHKAQHSKVDMETKLDKSLESQRKRKFLVTKQDVVDVVIVNRRKKNQIVVEKFVDDPNPFGNEQLEQEQQLIME